VLIDRSRPTREQLRRLALVYIRQSSPGQVLNNVESRELQYEFVERAVSLGWDRERVVVVDEDQGRRGSEFAGRGGFQRLVAEVGLGHVGLVLGIEVSRLSRRNADWYNLMDLCALTDTLIADRDGVYHTGDHNSRLALGLKGMMAESELHLIRQRLGAARLHKAAKGELRLLLPVGLDYDEQGLIVVSRDRAVRAAIAEVFARFEALTSARQVLLSLRADGLKLPCRKPGAVTVSWVEARYRPVHEILVKPAYAGAYVFGRTRQHKSMDGSGTQVLVRSRQVAREEWEVCIPEHHPGYISWARYLSNQQRLADNGRVRRVEPAAPRERAVLCCRGWSDAGAAGARRRSATGVSRGGERRTPAHARPTRPVPALCVSGSVAGVSIRSCSTQCSLRSSQPACARLRARSRTRRPSTSSACTRSRRPSNARGMRPSGPADSLTLSSRRTAWSPAASSASGRHACRRLHAPNRRSQSNTRAGP